MFKCIMQIKGGPKGMVSQFRAFVKDGLQVLVRAWHEGTLPKHFEKSAFNVYKYVRRSLKYQRYKDKYKPFAGPLVYSGRAQRELTRMIRVSGTSRRALGKMQAPGYFWMNPPDHPKKAEEMLKVNINEADAMAHKLNKDVTKKMKMLKATEIIK